MTIEEFAQVIALWKSRSFTRKCPCFQTIVFDAWEQLDTLGFQMNTEREKILRDSNAEAEECLSVLARRYSKESHFAKLTLWVMPRQHCVNFKPN
ncbi:hypothetical protein L596_020015 [Steinernema carpocapsae]|uniref:Uncharacterized protein n=1 Tax=Steinernema carpocapsae TaxID=34508 RepID=A0A4U5MSE9_STECR|nr:hypothetical protein L596_020015 [Steinernema carpocapsae]